MPRPFAIIIRDTIQSLEGTECARILTHANALDSATWPHDLPIGSGSMILLRTGFDSNADDMQPLWLAGPRAQWGAFAQHMQDLCARKGHIPVIWPRLGDVIADAPSLLTFIRNAPAWRFVVEPIALLTPEMLMHAPEHLLRFADLLFGHHACAGIVIRRAAFDNDPKLLDVFAKLLSQTPKAAIWVPAGDEAMLCEF